MKVEMQEHLKNNRRCMYNTLMAKVQDAELADKKTPLQNGRLKIFRIVEVGSEPIKYYVSADDIYNIIEAAHVAIGHGGRDRLKIETARKYANITIDVPGVDTGTFGEETKNWTFSTKHRTTTLFSTRVSPTKLASSGED
ncbi:hypothetical protein NQ318_008082 [Aromia moschata]|uniref:Uncharacterized protein n=1 Tax=Aromia moschata TaxID=1265417 RepID=A0AAV8YPA7_9CUCU|nr:hypothetical protein NQ318_008082 [Aromia moschata]